MSSKCNFPREYRKHLQNCIWTALRYLRFHSSFFGGSSPDLNHVLYCLEFEQAPWLLGGFSHNLFWCEAHHIEVHVSLSKRPKFQVCESWDSPVSTRAASFRILERMPLLGYRRLVAVQSFNLPRYALFKCSVPVQVAMAMPPFLGIFGFWWPILPVNLNVFDVFVLHKCRTWLFSSKWLAHMKQRLTSNIKITDIL